MFEDRRSLNFISNVNLIILEARSAPGAGSPWSLAAWRRVPAAPWPPTAARSAGRRTGRITCRSAPSSAPPPLTSQTSSGLFLEFILYTVTIVMLHKQKYFI